MHGTAATSPRHAEPSACRAQQIPRLAGHGADLAPEARFAEVVVPQGRADCLVVVFFLAKLQGFTHDSP